MFLNEWLRRVGLHGNPFALKQADEEGELLQACFVEHPAYAMIRSIDSPRSTLIHAPRGGGKSSARRMFEDYCASYADKRLFVVPLLDWNWAADEGYVDDPAPARAYVPELLRQFVVALATEAVRHALTPPQDAIMAGYLSWICATYDDYLDARQRDLLHARSLATSVEATLECRYNLKSMSISRILRLLVDIVGALGFSACFVLIDRIDELPQTVADRNAGANLILPLIGNLAVVETPGLVFKMFVPSEIVELLRIRHLLREDRLSCIGISWEGDEGRRLLRSLLQQRLLYFSNGELPSLAPLAEPDLRDLDEQLIQAARESPRALLNIGDLLLNYCAEESTDYELRIARRHLTAALAEAERRMAAQRLGAQSGEPDLKADPAPELPQATPERRSGAVKSASGEDVPLLSIAPDGTIYRGVAPLPHWQDIPPLQRKLLEYLYKHSGRKCERKELMKHLWSNEEEDPQMLRKLVKRLAEYIEFDPKRPVYLQQIRGGALALRHTPPRSGSAEPTLPGTAPERPAG
jgi:hypothetical protein